jgi:peroxiredoxin (alkyl hydroperoxide reductase subunit C)
MKKIILFILTSLSVTQIWSQESSVSSRQQETKDDRNFRIPLIGEIAPSFTAESTNGTIVFPADFGKRWKVLFSHPQDFTPVCSTEILELARLQEEFDKLGAKLIVVSTDLLETHVQWKKSLESLTLNDKENVKIKFPLVDDDKRIISKAYGMIHPTSNTTQAVRGVFIIDPDNIIQAIYFYPKSVGRNTDELIRMVTALQTTESGNVLTPVNWKAGNDLLVPVPPAIDGASGKATIPAGIYSPIWYLWFKKVSQSNDNLFESEN